MKKLELMKKLEEFNKFGDLIIDNFNNKIYVTIDDFEGFNEDWDEVYRDVKIDEDEEKVFGLGMGAVGWFIYGIMFIIAKITKCYTKENQAKRIVKSAKRQLKKSKKNWLKWYKKYGKYSSKAWNIVRTQYTEVLKEMRATGFDYNNSKEVM